jgi:hypothetical protein
MDGCLVLFQIKIEICVGFLGRAYSVVLKVPGIYFSNKNSKKINVLITF